MQVYRELKRGNTALPGDSTEQDILSELVASRNSVTVGVSDERNALGLLDEYLGEYDQAAVADSTDADVLSRFDLVVTPGGHRGITPLGETEARWESTSRSLRDKHIKEEIASIRESVETLSREHGLSNGEIRKRVQSSVPALKAPATSSNLGSTTSGSDDDYLIPPKAGLYVAVGAIVLLVLFAAVTFGPQVLGAIGLVDAGDQAGNAELNVNGTLVDNATDEQISATDVEFVELRNGTGTVMNSTEQPEYNFTITEGDIENATLVASVDGYEERRMNLSQDSPGGDLRLDPSQSLVEGSVIDSETGDGVSDATVTLTNDENETDETTTADGGEYSFENVASGEYTLSANADEYAASDGQQITVDSSETQVDAIELAPNVSASIQFVDENGSAVTREDVRLIDAETDEPIRSSKTNTDGWYNISVAAGTYEVELTSGDYEGTTAEVVPDGRASREIYPGEEFEIVVEATESA
ncbi:carboxypeptidase-like regulatory domain-containing protein [Halorubrum xinjiangense]|nr:carboxypeptidase-like regulatory domain-containing protein [Halorubrum xinjiangense]